MDNNPQNYTEIAITKAMQSGRYQTREEVVETALHLLLELDNNEVKKIALHKALADGLASGISESDPEETFERIFARIREKDVKTKHAIAS